MIDFYLTAVIQKQFKNEKVTETRFNKFMVKIKGIIPMILPLYKKNEIVVQIVKRFCITREEPERNKDRLQSSVKCMILYTV